MDNQEAITEKWTSTNESSRFTERERRLIDNCRAYVANDPAGLPGHNLMVIVAKLFGLLDGKELEGRILGWHILPNGMWSYGWHYSIPTHAKARVERALNG